jgi:hypothetical protein
MPKGKSPTKKSKKSSDNSVNAIKCVVVGDGTVGSETDKLFVIVIIYFLYYCTILNFGFFFFFTIETSLLITYSTNKFPTEYVPTVFDNYAVDLIIGDRNYTLALFDTGKQKKIKY